MSIIYRPRAVGALLLGVALAAACSDSGTLAPTELSPGKGKIVVQALTPADVIVQGTDLGSFTSFTANNSGRLTTEFWDNLSADNRPGNNPAVVNCNIGYFASGTMPAASPTTGCQNEAPGSTANQGGYSQFWGDGTGGYDASSFMFKGLYQYTVKLLGSYAGANSEVGYFTKDGTGYHFTAVPEWGSKTINYQMTINTSGTDWGFYIRNSFNPQTGGCSGTDTDCSDATGSFAGAPYQQHALFINGDQTKYLVGMEDNKLELGPYVDPWYDSDYQDYILSVEPQEPDIVAGGRMTGGGQVDVDGQAVTVAIEIHCDITLSNNIEVNWPGHKWHLDKPITFAACSDDPNVIQKPPVAPLDTFRGEGLGKLDNVAGSRIVFRFVDGGEPGTEDKAELRIYDASNALVLTVPLTLLSNGNIQAHYDQPHGDKP